MRDLALDPSTGDILIENGRARLTSGAEAVEQRLQARLRLWQGEYQLDRSKGIPYRRVLGRKGTAGLLESTLRRATETCPGVARVDTFRVEVTADRRALVTFSGRMSDGTPLNLDAFDAGEV